MEIRNDDALSEYSSALPVIPADPPENSGLVAEFIQGNP
jgi:hypothetical protein